MAVYRARSNAPASAAWELFARPERWHEWAPHLRGAWGLGFPEVEPGSRGAAAVLGALPVPATVMAKDPGRSWTWRVGPVGMDHRVRPLGDGCEVEGELKAPQPLAAALAVWYGPVIQLLLRNLARCAARARPVSRGDHARVR